MNFLKDYSLKALENYHDTKLNEISTNEGSVVDFEAKVNQLKEQGKKMLEDYKERGILVNDIDESMIIENWKDCKYLDANMW